MQIQPQKSTYALKPPVLPKKFLGHVLGRLESHGRYVQLSLAHEQLGMQVAERLSLDQVLGKQISLQGTELAHAQFSDCRLVECDLAQARWFQADFARVELLGCRMTGFHTIEARLQDVLLKDCQAGLAQFRFATFKGARFENCDLSDADFQGADLSGVVFLNCNLSRAEMSGAKLVGADLRGCEIDGLHAGWHELQGAKIDPAQALALVRASGVLVEWSGGQANEHDNRL